MVAGVGHPPVGRLEDFVRVLVKCELIEHNVPGIAARCVGVRRQGNNAGTVGKLDLVLLLFRHLKLPVFREIGHYAVVGIDHRLALAGQLQRLALGP